MLTIRGCCIRLATDERPRVQPVLRITRLGGTRDMTVEVARADRYLVSDAR